ncbi:phosphatase PAP2 family protein [Methanolobus profundi]|uniref:PAP2 superfamily protein n=1 Tax=Methanolobus profundi TaxID=487685 RepID=A0A1I4S0E3_9EURY|nr:phosphatase PAP2 family protein [Methanolobus profundi]SFM57998.1 PAP2 superfamily protein [Methanolobus profundi]
MADLELMAIFIPVVLMMNIIAYFVFIPRQYWIEHKKLISEKNEAYSFTKEIMPYILLVSVIYLVVKSQGSIATMLDISPDYALASYIFHIEGNTVSIFQSFTDPLLTYVSSFIYLFGFSFLLVFTFVALIFTRHIKALQEYAIAVVVIYAVAFPFYLFTPVKVTGYTLPDVVPLLYELSPIISNGLRTVDPFFDNCFPSLHAALSFLAMLIIIFRTDIRRFKVVAVFMTLAIQFTIFYLGIHWITDLIGGIVLAIISYYVATRYHDPIVRKLHASSDRDDEY